MCSTRDLRSILLSAKLNFDLGLALKHEGDEAGARRALELAGKLDPEIGARGLK